MYTLMINQAMIYKCQMIYKLWSITMKIMSFLLNKEEKIGRAYKCTAFAEEQINYCHTKFFVQQINTTA